MQDRYKQVYTSMVYMDLQNTTVLILDETGWIAHPIYPDYLRKYVAYWT